MCYILFLQSISPCAPKSTSTTHSELWRTVLLTLCRRAQTHLRANTKNFATATTTATINNTVHTEREGQPQPLAMHFPGRGPSAAVREGEGSGWLVVYGSNSVSGCERLCQQKRTLLCVNVPRIRNSGRNVRFEYEIGKEWCTLRVALATAATT